MFHARRQRRPHQHYRRSGHYPFEIDEAASRIKEEVDEDANIIFGSSFDESLAGKIRVSIVATGIGENIARQAQSKPLIKPGYLEESYGGETVITPNEELDSNLENSQPLNGSR